MVGHKYGQADGQVVGRKYGQADGRKENQMRLLHMLIKSGVIKRSIDFRSVTEYSPYL